MKKSVSIKLVTLISLVVLLALVFVPLAHAGETREGENVTIPADTVIADDLYVGASNFTLDGTVKGDLIVAGANITINGVVEGDLIAAGQSLIINGTVMDDARVAGYAITVSKDASIGSDLVAAAFSIETKPQSTISGDLWAAAAQVLVGGEVGGDMRVGAEGLAIEGKVRGNVSASVGTPSEETPAELNPATFNPNLPPVPMVPSGLTLGANAQIGGDLDYRAAKESNIPSGIVAGAVKFTQEIDKAMEGVKVEISPSQKALNFVLDQLRYLIALALIGLVLAWQVPFSFKQPSEAMQAKPWPGLGWGVVIYILVPIAVLFILGVVILATVILGALTLGQLASSVIFLGLALLAILIVLYALIIVYLTKIVVGYWIGRFILTKVGSQAANNIYWSLLVGLLVLVILFAIPFLGWLLKLIATLFGLGALVLISRDWLSGKGKAGELTAAVTPVVG